VSTRSLILLGAFLATRAFATTFTVDRVDDTASATGCMDAMPNDCSLRGAIIAANGAPGLDMIVLPAGTYPLSVKGVAEDLGATGDLDITDDLMLQGAGSATTIIDGAQLGDMTHTSDRIIQVDSMGSGTLNVTITGVTLRNATAETFPTVSSIGAALLNGDARTSGTPVGSTVTLSDVVVQGNFSTAGGGGIGNYGTLTILGSVIEDNSTDNVGGAIGQGDTGSLELHDTTVSGNTAAADGGGIYVGFLGTSSGSPAVTIVGCTLNDNMASRGGALFRNGGTVTIANSTFSHNTASNAGTSGGAIHAAGGAVTMSNATVALNVGGGQGGGIYGAATLGNTILAGNTAPTGPDCNGTITSTGHDLIQVPCTIAGDTTGNVTGQAADLGPLADHGGPTRTHPALPGSPAVDAGDPGVPGSGGTACEATDQRGMSRPQPPGGLCDIGAFELVPGEIPTTTTTSTTTLVPPTSTNTTSTTQPSPDCTMEPARPTFVSIDCRLAALVASVDGATQLGALQPKLAAQLAKVSMHEDDAETACDQASRRRARSALHATIKKLTQLRRTLRSHTGRPIPPALALDLLATVDSLLGDLRALRRTLRCPPGVVTSRPRFHEAQDEAVARSSELPGRAR
jgi:predicted outer membrane repeat protein